MSTVWHKQYLSALAARDRLEHTSKSIYDAYSQLADKKSRQPLSTKPSLKDTKPQSPPSPRPLVATTVGRVASWSRGTAANTTDSPTGFNTGITAGSSLGTGSLASDLASAQRHRALLEKQLQAAQSELSQLKASLQASQKKATELATENTTLNVKLRDRIEELRAKAKLVQDVHDESVALTLQVNLCEERCEKLERENKELVERWMVRVGADAERLNDVSRFS